MLLKLFKMKVRFPAPIKLNKYRNNKEEEEDDKEENKEGLGRRRVEGGMKRNNNKAKNWVFRCIIIDRSFCDFSFLCPCTPKCFFPCLRWHCGWLCIKLFG